MFFAVLVIIIALFFLLRAFTEEMEKQAQLRLNATLRNRNASFFMDDGFDNAWMIVRALDNITAGENQTKLEPVTFEPDWKLVLGTYEHVKDENFEEFLIAAGVPYFVRNMILSSKPVVTIERIYEEEDYYYEIEDDYPDPDYDHHVVSEDNRVYQIVLTSSTFLVTHEARFRLGYYSVKNDYDGTESKNLMKFIAPSVMVQFKEKGDLSTNIRREFSEEGILVTIVNIKSGMVAKRHYKRIHEDD
ncbi:fatty acid-binding protein-like [Palaemon carinicauda]|uniref:fatty acid-binding protein-like n=1 Tax=Palaemon carinicauda TaxID=392227 RepID=UPI0035B5C174